MFNSIEVTVIRNKGYRKGESCCCPMCGKEFIKNSYQQVFCGVGCKEKYWNKKRSNRHRDPDYHRRYNMAHPERLERVGLLVANTPKSVMGSSNRGVAAVLGEWG